MSLHRLLFDTANPAESANVGAYLRASDGTLLTHTAVSGTQSLDVNLTSRLTAATDNVAISDGTDTLQVNADGSINVVPPHLAAATDSAAAWVHDGAGTSIGSHTISAAGYLNVASALFDGAGTALTSTLISGKQGLDVNVINSANFDDALANTAISAEAESVTTTEGALIATPLANRKYVFAYNNGSKIVYLGTTGVTTATGFPLFPGSILEMRLGASVAPHAVAQSGTQDVRVMQLS